MTSTKHTPGPWRADPYAYCSGIYRIYPYHETVSKLKQGGIPSVSQMTEDMANARLIAAAPDLLNALTVLADHCDKVGIPVHAARAAIAKATGREAA